MKSISIVSEDSSFVKKPYLESSPKKLYIVPPQALSRRKEKPAYFLSYGLFGDSPLFGIVRESTSNQLQGTAARHQERDIRQFAAMYGSIMDTNMYVFAESAKGGIGQKMREIIQLAGRESGILLVNAYDRFTRLELNELEAALPCDVFLMYYHQENAHSLRVSRGIADSKKFIRNNPHLRYSDDSRCREIIEIVVQKKAEGLSNRSIARYLNKYNYRKRNGSLWDHRTVGRILKHNY